MKKNWNVLTNRFETATRRNYKKMLGMIVFHAGALGSSSDPYLRNLNAETEPLREAYCNAHSAWLTAKGCRKGESLRFRQLIKELYTEKIPAWEANVLVRFAERTPEYKSIFTEGRTGFRYGPYDLRIERVAALALKLGDFPGLFTIRNEVQDFHDKLLKARKTNKGESVGVKETALQLETLRKAAAIKMYANMGLLMSHHCEEPSLIRKYFPDHLRRKSRKKKPVDNIPEG